MADFQLNRTWLQIQSWMDRLWDSLSVSQQEKDFWNAGTEGAVIVHESTYNHAKIETSAQIKTGEKSSLIDAGTKGDISITDDYLYVCVVTGDAGEAVWKKTILFQT